MIKLFIIVMGSALAFACSLHRQTATSATPVQERVDTSAGWGVIRKNDCITCHAVSRELIGPSFTRIADRYPGDSITIDKLAQKIRRGGSGSWGSLPMVPHSSLTDADARLAITCILTIKTK